MDGDKLDETVAITPENFDRIIDAATGVTRCPGHGARGADSRDRDEEMAALGMVETSEVNDVR